MTINPVENPVRIPRVWGGRPLDARTRPSGQVAPTDAASERDRTESDDTVTFHPEPAEYDALPPGVRAYTHFAFSEFAKGRLIDFVTPR